MTIIPEPVETPEGKAYREWLRWASRTVWATGCHEDLSSGEMRRVIDDRLRKLAADEEIADMARHYVALIDKGPTEAFRVGQAHSTLLSWVRQGRKAA